MNSYNDSINTIIECNNNEYISKGNDKKLSFNEVQFLYWEKEQSHPVNGLKSFPGNEDSCVLTLSNGHSIKKYMLNNFILLNEGKLYDENMNG